MAINVQEYQLLQDFKKEGTERAEKLEQYSADATAAKSRLHELQTQYELTFTKSVMGDKAATEKLPKIDGDIALQREVVARRDRDKILAQQAIPPQVISPVEVATKYRTEFAPGVQKEFVEKVNPKLTLARDLVLSALADSKEYASEYDGLYSEMSDMAESNHKRGLTQYRELQQHPTRSAPIFGQVGTISGVRRLLEQISQYTFNKIPDDYNYIDVAPNKTEKGAK